MTLPAAPLVRPAGRARARHPRPHPARDGPGRGPRPARRRIPPLQRGRRVDRAPLREDVVRQLRAAQGLRSTPTPCSAPRSTPTPRAGSCAGYARCIRPGRRLRGQPGRRRGPGRRRRLLHLDPATRPRPCCRAEELDVAAAYYDIGTAGEMHHNPAKNVLFVAAHGGLARRPARAHRGRGPRHAGAGPGEALRGAGRASRAVRRPHPLHQLERDDGRPPCSARARCWATRRPPPRAPHPRSRCGTSAWPTTRWRTRPAASTGLLDDQVQVAAAALDAHEATGELEWLTWAGRLMDRVWADYWDEERRRAVRYGARTRASGAGSAARPGQAGPGRADPVAQWRGRDRLRAPARAHRRRALARARAGAGCGAFAGRAGELGPLRRGLPAGPRLALSRRPRTWSSSASRAIPWPTGCTPTRWRVRPAPGGAAPRAGRRGGPRRCRRPWPAWWPPAGRRAAYACTGTSCRAPADTVEAVAGHADALIPPASLDWRAGLRLAVLHRSITPTRRASD